MVEPQGYTALDLVGYTDKGTYSPSATYVKNDLVHYSGNIWRVLIDDISNVTPAEGVSYTLFIGEPSNLVEQAIAPIEDTPSTRAYTVGRRLFYNDKLYEVIAAIAIGDDLATYEDTPATANIKLSKKVEEQIDDINTEAATHLKKYASDSSQWDSSPTKASTKPVTSGGLFTAFSAHQSHNIPRLVPKDITSYFTDGTFYKRLAGTDGFSLFEDIYVGDYMKMSRAVTAPNQDSQYATTGSQYITLIGLDTLMGNGDGGDSVSVINYHHSIWTAGQGFGGIQHFGRKRMNSSNVTTGGYVGSEMHTATLGAAVTTGSTASTATINQQLYAEFGSHLKKTRELLSNAVDTARYNRFGQNSGATSGWAWTTCQAVLMSEIEVYGSIVFSSSGQDTGNANKQMPLFMFSKEAVNNRSAYYWLKDVASGAYFCICYDSGHASNNDASNASRYVRPRFILA